MPRKTVFDMSFASVYSALVQKAERKGRSKAEVDQVIGQARPVQVGRIEENFSLFPCPIPEKGNSRSENTEFSFRFCGKPIDKTQPLLPWRQQELLQRYPGCSELLGLYRADWFRDYLVSESHGSQSYDHLLNNSHTCWCALFIIRDGLPNA